MFSLKFDAQTHSHNQFKNTKHIKMFSKSTCTNESHSLQFLQQGRKSKYRIELHTTPQTLQVANLVALESLPHIQHM
jgi:putative heme iron utilization protein